MAQLRMTGPQGLLVWQENLGRAQVWAPTAWLDAYTMVLASGQILDSLSEEHPGGAGLTDAQLTGELTALPSRGRPARGGAAPFTPIILCAPGAVFGAPTGKDTCAMTATTTAPDRFTPRTRDLVLAVLSENNTPMTVTELAEWAGAGGPP